MRKCTRGHLYTFIYSRTHADVHVYMYACNDTCACLHEYVYTHVHIMYKRLHYTRISLYIHACVRIYGSTKEHVYTSTVYVYVGMSIGPIFICIRTHVCVNMRVCACVCIFFLVNLSLFSCLRPQLSDAAVSQQSKYRQRSRIRVFVPGFVRAESVSHAVGGRITERNDGRYCDNCCDPAAKTSDVGRWPLSSRIQLPLPRHTERMLC